MTVAHLKEKLGLDVVVEGDLSRDVTGGYCGDLLSWVMGRAEAGDAWITVMGNINAIAVCVLADVSCMILAEDSPLDEAAKVRAQTEDITVLRSGDNAYTLAVKLAALL